MPRRIMFHYWGRRGAVQQLTLEVAWAALAEPEIATTISVSRQSELFGAFKELRLVPSVLRHFLEQFRSAIFQLAHTYSSSAPV